MAQLTSKDLWRIWQDLDLRDWDEREVVDELIKQLDLKYN